MFCGGVVEVGGSVGHLLVVWASSNWRRPLDFTPFSIKLHPNTISKALEIFFEIQTRLENDLPFDLGLNYK